jgi:hypothetical protein
VPPGRLPRRDRRNEHGPARVVARRMTDTYRPAAYPQRARRNEHGPARVVVQRMTETYHPAAHPQRARARDRHTVSVYQRTGSPAPQRTQPRQQTPTAACGCRPCAWRLPSRQQASHDHPCSAPSNGSKDTQRPPSAPATSHSSRSLLPQQQQQPPLPTAAASSPSSSSLLPQQQGCRRGRRQQPSARPDRRPAISRVRRLPGRAGPGRASKQTREGAAAPTTRRCFEWKGRKRGPEPQSVNIQSRLRLRPAMRPTARTRSWLAHCSGQRGPEPQRSKAAQRHEAPSEPRPTAMRRRPVRPPPVQRHARAARRQQQCRLARRQ